ncbi:hypothetical protein OG884_15860 [Streptosporangium sp. NBC_01755]|uniref:hypothetical protein n=1 Tax=unclassified Streptosporangium TaxID=2632669 RepID=UPI002DDBE250|nr:MULTISPECIES: hypothetical protein [unclassified Streptosporangium]WSA25377.1 hypothetical protein OIE13_31375 [Streptosporangium sp. NBC_01810]WSD03307.1 hypothetical protein OG884_15860 [Streptosporangium sp. NBC_01755]
MTPGPDEFSTAETLANEPPRRRVPRSVLLVATTALVVATGAGVAAAAAFSPSPSPTPTVGDTATPSAAPSGAPSDKVPGQGRGRGHKMGFGGPSIHGEFVVPDGEGKYVTVATQYGDVTAVDQDSITVKSEDGYTKEYAINGDTRINRRGEGIDAVKTGQKVMVMAKVDGGTTTAVAIHDATARDGYGRRGEGGRRHGTGAGIVSRSTG